ncbi:MAG: glycoside hydrolase family 15 protein [Planctomycetaceae bacterium]
MTRIEDYALLGDLQTAALVSLEGSIDWCCFPRFDSAASFAAILGGPDYGRWKVAPAGDAQTTRQYRDETLILETTHETAEGVVRVIDFMPPRGRSPDIVRIVEGVQGRVTMRSELVIRFDYGHVVPWVQRVDHARLAVAGPDAMCLRTPVNVRGEELTTVSDFVVEPGERIPFVLTWFPSHEALPDVVDPEAALEETVAYWREWAVHCQYTGTYEAEVRQSLLVLKSLTYAPTGGIVAAPTTSLPEHIGGVRNWDYRYCWLRDAAMTIGAMLSAGYRDEARDWRDWLLRAVAGCTSEVQIMYGIAGERRLPEMELPWLPGFANSQPVRIGNAAAKQLQLDVFGELMEVAYLTVRHGVEGSDTGWSVLRRQLHWLEEGWRLPDAGIWEVRGPDRHFTYSKVMAWVAFDRAVRMHDEFGRDGPVDRWKALRAEIEAEILEKGWSEKKQAFTQSYGSDALDASLLLMPILGFLPADDERFASTVDAIRRELSVGGFLLRYRQAEHVDGLPAGEGVFLACSFWLVSVLALQGKMDEATELFDALLALRNDVGLLAEEYDPEAGMQLGNFPQALTHLSLVEAAMHLSGDWIGIRDGSGTGKATNVSQSAMRGD